MNQDDAQDDSDHIAQTGVSVDDDTGEANPIFSQPMDEDDDRRRLYRRSVLWPAKLKVGQHVFSCQVWNLSLGGARLRFDIPISEGAEVTINIGGRGDIQAHVVWVSSNAMGLEFEASPDAVRTMFQDRLHILGLDETEAYKVPAP